MKNTVDVIKKILAIAEEKKSEHEDIAIETIQNEMEKIEFKNQQSACKKRAETHTSDLIQKLMQNES